MRTGKRPWIIVLLFYLGATSAAVSFQEKTTPSPPSYNESSPWNRRQPGIDTDVSLYINHWRNSAPRQGHGGLIEYDILTRGNAQKAEKKGAVLTYLQAYRYGVLGPHSSTEVVRQEREQGFFFVMSGRGRLEAGTKKAGLDEGTAVVIPAGLGYRFINEADHPLGFFIGIEETPHGFVPNAAASVGSYRASKPILGAHWAHVGRPFSYDLEPKFANPMGFIVVSIDKFDIAQPHTHPPGAEEIWLQLKGRSLLFLGKSLMRQEPGEAFLVPPTNRDPHSSINPSQEPMLWLFFGCRK